MGHECPHAVRERIATARGQGINPDGTCVEQDAPTANAHPGKVQAYGLPVTSVLACTGRDHNVRAGKRNLRLILYSQVPHESTVTRVQQRISIQLYGMFGVVARWLARDRRSNQRYAGVIGQNGLGRSSVHGQQRAVLQRPRFDRIPSTDLRSLAIEIAGQNDPGGKGRQRQQQAAEQRARRQRMGCGGGALHGGILVSEKGERRDTTQPHSDEVPYILHLCDGGVKGGQLRSHVSLLAPVSVRSPAEPMQKVVKHTEHR